MRLDKIIQTGVFTGSGGQIACIDQAARDANFEGYGSADQYLETIQESHNEESIEFDRGPIDPIAFGHLSISIQHAWKKWHS
jgi:hypothetical protein